MTRDRLNLDIVTHMPGLRLIQTKQVHPRVKHFETTCQLYFSKIIAFQTIDFGLTKENFYNNRFS